jgi:predicted acylesterase/phospholipase RssA/CRP-like cAMP-binding protein
MTMEAGSQAASPPSQHLRTNPLFRELDPELLAELDRHVSWVRLEGGEILCREGDPPEALYVVVHGLLEVLFASESGQPVLDVLGRGDSIGEIALFQDQPRSATVRAIRDSELVRIPARAFHRLTREPSFVTGLARILAARLRERSRSPRMRRRVQTIAILPASTGEPVDAFMAGLEAALSGLDARVLSVNRSVAASKTDRVDSDDFTAWLNHQEEVYRFVLYECEAQASPWTLRALRQADLILVVASCPGDPEPSALETEIASRQNALHTRRELVLLHAAGTSLPGGTASWLRSRSSVRHHHLRRDNAADFGRLARWLNGSSLGVALSGGGARGFAHIGALKALRDRKLAVDLIGGTSMGSVIAAQAALGWDIETMIERNRREFMECAVWGDMTLPYVSILRGRSTVRLLRSLFGDAQIEDLWLPYFCVSTNLSRAQVVVHEAGPLWLWIRASSSVPGIGPPVPHGGDLLVDGGLLNNLPVDLMRARCPGPIVGSDASPAVTMTTTVPLCAEMSGWPQAWRRLNRWSSQPRFPHMMEILMRTAMLSSAHTTARSRIEADLYLDPPVDHFSPLDWGAIERIVEIGYRHACDEIDRWQRRDPRSPADTLSEGHADQ